MIRKALGLMTLVGGVVLIACGDDEPTAKYPTAESFCDAKAAEECKIASPTCAVTEAACKAKRVDVCMSAAGAARAQGRTYDPAKAEDCLAKTTEVFKDRVIDPVKEEAFQKTCERVFVGFKKKNDTCSNIFECEGELVCDLEKGSVCADKVDKQDGDGCANPGETCGKGFFCQLRNGGVRTCTPKQKLDQPCSAVDNPCEESLRCVNVCVPKVPAGDACELNEDCATGLCNAEKKCAARQYPSETGSCRDFGGS